MTPTATPALCRGGAPAAGTDQKRRPRRWRRRLCAAGVLLVLLLVFHAPLFRLLAGLLVVNDDVSATDAVVLFGASGPFHAAPFSEAARLYGDGRVQEIVLIEDRSSRLVRAGVVPTVEEVGRRELAAGGVPVRALTVLADDQPTDWDRARRLATWLDGHPGASATVLCDEFDSRRLRDICRAVLGAETAARLRWRALPDRRYGVTNWWHSRQGIVQFAGAYVSLLHAHAFGEPPQGSGRWDPDDYERRLKAPDR